MLAGMGGFVWLPFVSDFRSCFDDFGVAALTDGKSDLDEETDCLAGPDLGWD